MSPEKFLSACLEGDLITIKGIIKSGVSNLDIDKGFINSCESGSLETVQYLLTSSELIENGFLLANIHANNDRGFKWACTKNHLEVVKYLLTSPDLKVHSNLHSENEWSLRYASNPGYLELVQYLLESRDLTQNGILFADISANNYECLINAAGSGKLEVVQYLLTKKGKKANVHAQENRALIRACNNNQIEVVKYLLETPQYYPNGIDDIGHILLENAVESESLEVLDYLIRGEKITKTPKITYFLEWTKPCEIKEQCTKWFSLVELNHHLGSSLGEKTAPAKKFKI